MPPLLFAFYREEGIDKRSIYFAVRGPNLLSTEDLKMAASEVRIKISRVLNENRPFFSLLTFLGFCLLSKSVSE